MIRMTFEYETLDRYWRAHVAWLRLCRNISRGA